MENAFELKSVPIKEDNFKLNQRLEIFTIEERITLKKNNKEKGIIIPSEEVILNICLKIFCAKLFA